MSAYCGPFCPFVRDCGMDCPAPGGGTQGTLIFAGQTSYNDGIPEEGRGMLRGHATPEQNDPPEPYLAIRLDGGSDRERTSAMPHPTHTLPRSIPAGHSLCYVVGWPSLGAIKIGNAAGPRRVKRWTSMRDGQLLRLDVLPHWAGGCIRETELAIAAGRWPRRWHRKDQAATHLGSRTDGWTEFYAVPVDQWHDFLTALEVHP